MNAKYIALLIGGLLIILVALLSWGHIPTTGEHTATTTPTTVTTKSELPGLQVSNGPWTAELQNLKQRLGIIGLPALSEEGTALHIHQHLDIIINGAMIHVPAEIGVSEAQKFISPIHVHDTTGIIHVESPTAQDFTLGQFFDIWGVRLTTDCIGGYCTDATHSLKIYSNGALVSADPRKLVLASHQEIMIVYGDASSTPKIISGYSFPAGY